MTQLADNDLRLWRAVMDGAAQAADMARVARCTAAFVRSHLEAVYGLSSADEIDMQSGEIRKAAVASEGL